MAYARVRRAKKTPASVRTNYYRVCVCILLSNLREVNMEMLPRSRVQPTLLGSAEQSDFDLGYYGPRCFNSLQPEVSGNNGSSGIHSIQEVSRAIIR